MRLAVIGVVGLALLCAACVPDRPAGPGRGVRAFGGANAEPEDEEEQEGPRPPRVQLFISPSGQPFRAPVGQPYPSAAWFAAADADHDGKLTRAEFRADAEAWFKVLDVNKDGQISMPEVTRWEEELVPEITRATYGGYGGGRGGPLRRNEIDTRAQGAASYSLINEPHPIRGADADFSMGVSLAEWRAAADRRFDLLDDKVGPRGGPGVKDGAILLADLPKTPAQESGRDKPRKGGGPGGGGPGGGMGGGGARRGPPR